MFCDLVGSTALSARFDPEDLREVIGAYHRCVADTVARFEGFVAKYMGDGVLAYFGYPKAHEDDSERAVRAGLAAIDAVARLDISERLAVRLGVASGIDGLVASPHEARMLRAEFGDKIKIVTPGIRPAGADPGDQKRFATPREALDAGADYLVIGRPITGASDPKAAAQSVAEDLAR
jgi:hypothetical protein